MWFDNKPIEGVISSKFYSSISTSADNLPFTPCSETEKAGKDRHCSPSELYRSNWKHQSSWNGVCQRPSYWNNAVKSRIQSLKYLYLGLSTRGTDFDNLFIIWPECSDSHINSTTFSSPAVEKSLSSKRLTTRTFQLSWLNHLGNISITSFK